MGLPKNRVTIPHTAGASEQFVLAGSGQRAPLPGYHRMSTGEHMRNDDQTGGGGGSQNLFGTIAVSGQSNIVADNTSDTLTLVAGTNITIATNQTTDEITINSTAGGGGGGGLSSRSTINYTTTSINNNAQENFDVAGGFPTYALLKIQVSL